MSASERTFMTKDRQDLIAASSWIAPTATVMGHVELQENTSVWYGAVIRGDVEPISVGVDSNIQDLCCLHSDPGFPTVVGNRVTVGHRAILHGATIEDEVLIGMGAIVLNGANIGSHSIIGAGALVAEGKQIPPRSLVVGVPGKIIREVTDEDVERILAGSKHYVQASREHAARKAGEHFAK